MGQLRFISPRAMVRMTSQRPYSMTQRSDVNAPDRSGVTAFHLACVSGNLKLCELFLKHGADVLATNAEGKNALHEAAASGHTMIVEMLIETGE